MTVERKYALTKIRTGDYTARGQEHFLHGRWSKNFDGVAASADRLMRGPSGIRRVVVQRRQVSAPQVVKEVLPDVG